MEKKHLFGFVICTCLIFLSVYISLKQPRNIISNLTLENIEALTYDLEGEGAVIECGSRATKGRCWRESNRLKFYGSYSYYECEFIGYTYIYCTEPV